MPIAPCVRRAGGSGCTLVAAFAVPTTETVELASAWVPMLDFAPKGQHWEYSGGSVGVGKSGAGSPAALAAATAAAFSSPVARRRRYAGRGSLLLVVVVGGYADGASEHPNPETL